MVEPGLVLTFDDLFVRGWLQARPLWDAHDARVTFCVSRLHLAKAGQIKGLHLLQDEGHEIGFHTRTHPKLKTYLREHGVAHWLEHEIDAGIAEHRDHGFPAESFAPPYHASTPATRRETGRRFKLVRGARPGPADASDAATRVYAKPGAHRGMNILGNADMKRPNFLGWDWQMDMLDLVAENEGVGLFAGHNLHAEDRGGGSYSTLEQLEAFLKAARERGLRFYTMSEFGDLAGE